LSRVFRASPINPPLQEHIKPGLHPHHQSPTISPPSRPLPLNALRTGAPMALMANPSRPMPLFPPPRPIKAHQRLSVALFVLSRAPTPFSRHRAPLSGNPVARHCWLWKLPAAGEYPSGSPHLRSPHVSLARGSRTPGPLHPPLGRATRAAIFYIDHRRRSLPSLHPHRPSRLQPVAMW
jgi:hypothetical protein